MGKTILGILVAAIALYVWGFLFWGVSTIPYESLKQTADDEATQQMLRQYFPESGTYLVPGPNHEADEREALSLEGPVATVHIDVDGASTMDPVMMIGGFVLDVIVVALLAMLFRVAGAREFRDFVRLSLATAAVAVVMIDIGDIIWWQETASWKVWPAIYNFTGILLAGHLLGAFMKQSTEATAAI